MTDEEIVKAIAEKVMGWHINVNTIPPSTGFWETYSEEEGQVFRAYLDWNPLTNEADNAAVLEKMAEKFSVCLSRSGIHELEKWEFEIWKPDVTAETIAQEWQKDRKRAICLAALKAVDHA